MEEQLIRRLADFGAVGIIAAIALWQVFALSKRLFSVIENNTRVMTELKVIIEQYFKNSPIK